VVQLLALPGSDLIPMTDAQETSTRNWYQKLLPVSGTE